jgi:Domain of unknown function (DUF4382)
MQRNMLRRAVYCALLTGLTASLAGCGGGGGSGSGSSTSASAPPPETMGQVPLLLSDAASDDWACVGVRVLTIALLPSNGGSPVTVWSAASPAPYVNLVQLDQLGELLGNVSVPAGTYSGAVLTIAANPGDVLLTVANNPESGFPVVGGTSIPSDQIQIQGAQGASGSRTVTVDVNFANNLTVTAGESNTALDVEFDLGHPAFIVAHTPPAADGATVFAVNFNGPVRHHPVGAIAALLLRHMYGTVTGVSSAAITINKDFPVYPASNPETESTSNISLTIDADSVNGTIVYDLDAGTRTVVDNFGSESGLNNRFVRVAARYQTDGTLTAVRVWVSSDFNKVWLSPEGHVLNANATAGTLTVTNEDGVPVTLAVGANTQFFFRTPANALADATPIGQGAAFLSNVVRGFKVHVGSMNPLQVPMPATTVDIETAAFGGQISNAASESGGTSGQLTYTSQYLATADNYSLLLPFIAGGADNGYTDSNGTQTQITGFKWWYFTLPTQAEWGATGISDFVSATNGAVNLGGSLGNLAAWGASDTRWGDGVSGDGSSGWHLNDAVVVPTPLPLGTVSTALTGTSFAMSVLGGTTPVTVNLNTNTGSATLVYQVNRSGGMVTVTPLDISDSGDGLTTLQAALTSGAIVKVWGVPQAPVAPATSGTLGAYVLVYYSGTMPNM